MNSAIYGGWAYHGRKSPRSQNFKYRVFMPFLRLDELPGLFDGTRHLARDTDIQLTHLRDITEGYADTLACWRERFNAALPQVREQGFDEIFERMWEFYLCYCEGGFRERAIGTVQVTFAKPEYRFRA